MVEGNDRRCTYCGEPPFVLAIIVFDNGNYVKSTRLPHEQTTGHSFYMPEEKAP